MARVDFTKFGIEGSIGHGAGAELFNTVSIHSVELNEVNGMKYSKCYIV